MTKYKKKTVLITGGTSGIGKAFAERFIAEGARVAITGRNEARANAVAKEIGAEFVHIGDIGRQEVREALAAKVAEKFGSLDVLVNNAGFMITPDLISGDGLELLESEALTNFVAPIDLSSRLIPNLKQAKGASIVMVSSGYALAPGDKAPTYSGTKAGLHAFTKSLRRIVSDYGISVVEVLPPLTDTPAVADNDGKKVSPEEVVEETLRGMAKGKAEIPVGQVKQLPLLLRLLPKTAEKMVAQA